MIVKYFLTDTNQNLHAWVNPSRNWEMAWLAELKENLTIHSNENSLYIIQANIVKLMNSENMEAKKKKKNITEKGQEEEEEENEVLKRRISSHPLYGLLIEYHMDCLKVGSIESAEGDHHHQEIANYEQHESTKPSSSSMHSSSELDHFMEAYCSALRRLKEAMKEPQQETLSFFNNMHSQLRELTRTTHPAPANTSSGERD